jgi:diacylglycerol kinase (ATP)
LCAVCNGAWFGGGMHIAPGAQVDDGLLDVVVASDITRFQMLSAMGHLYRGTAGSLPQVRVFRGRRVEVSPSVPSGSYRFELDGQLGVAAPAAITVLPRALRLIV